MKKFLLLGIAAGLNKAGMFFLVPIFGFFISVEAFGELSLFFVVSTIATTILGMNVSAIISREIYKDLHGVISYLKVFNIYHILLVLLLCLLQFLFDSAYIVFFIYIALESIFLVNSTFIRYKLGDNTFVKLTLLKFLYLTIGISIYLYNVSYGNTNYHISMVFFLLALSNTPVICFVYRSFKIKNNFTLERSYIVFALCLLPHVISQWINSGVDRYFVKWFFNETTLGYYSFAYSIAAVFLLVNASLSLSLPQLAIKNFKKYYSVSFFSLFSLAVTCFYLLSLCFLYFFVPLIGSYEDFPVLSLSIIILSGCYLLCYYTYYSTVLFYQRRAVLISSITVFYALVNLIILYPMSANFGIFGTAMVTYIIYSLYSFSVAFYVKRKIPIGMLIPITISIFVLAINYN